MADNLEIRWGALAGTLGDNVYLDNQEECRRKIMVKGARILRYKLKGGFCRNISRTRQEALEVIATTGIADNPEGVFEILCSSGFVKGEYYGGAQGTERFDLRFRLKPVANSKGSVKYKIEDEYGPQN